MGSAAAAATRVSHVTGSDKHTLRATGLGKTIQVAALLGALKHSKKLLPSVIVCPATVINHWVRELHKWYAASLLRCSAMFASHRVRHVVNRAPALRVLVVHASGSGIMAGVSRDRIVSSIRK